MVTAETALTIPVIVAVAALVIGGLATMSVQNQACHGARVAARSVSIGEGDAHATSLAQRVAGTPVGVSVAHSADLATVTVSATGPGILRLPVKCSVIVRKEDSYR